MKLVIGMIKPDAYCSGVRVGADHIDTLLVSLALVANVSDLAEIEVERVKHFFAHYKDLEPGKWAKVSRVGDANEAKNVIRACIEAAGKAKRS